MGKLQLAVASCQSALKLCAENSITGANVDAIEKKLTGILSMQYQHPEFTRCPQIDQGSEPFQQVMHGFPVVQILWPKNTKLALEIWDIIHQSQINELYAQLFALTEKTADLRPHLLYLLYGFKENDKTYQLDIDRFLTLHWFAQLIVSGFKTIEAIPVSQGLNLLRLNQEEKRQFTTTQMTKQLPSSENALFKIEVDEHTVVAQLMFFQ